MSDFLDTLTNRSFAPSADIGPRPLGRFESAQGPATAMGGMPDASTSSDFAEPAQLLEPAVDLLASGPAPVPTHGQTDAPAHTPRGSSASPVTDAIRASSVSSSPSLGMLRTATREPHPESWHSDQLADPGLLQPADMPPAQPSERTIIERVIVREEHRQTEDQTGRDVEGSLVPAASDETATPSRQHDSDRALARVEAVSAPRDPAPVYAPPVAEARPAVIEPRVTPHREDARYTARERAVEPATPVVAPTIQVKIGRIEVRATTASPPPKKERRTPNVMSLDDYLRQRNRGGSR